MDLNYVPESITRKIRMATRKFGEELKETNRLKFDWASWECQKV
ncbi:MAG: hypothetical protein ACRC1M_05935 [Methanobacteriaceae archaeon]